MQRDSTGPSGGDFELDLKDNRFARLLEGDSSFGIDRTSADFKETKAMKQIFGEQRSRREKGEADAAKGGQVQGQKQLDVSVSKVASSTADVDSLVTKLKRKFNEENGKTKQPRL